jgi:beta-phosphoglucomutase-like phosphatase (HAD superfamily)
MPTLRCVLWDFGNTLVDESFLAAPPHAIPGWAEACDAAWAEHGRAWNLGQMDTTRYAAHLAQRLGVSSGTVLDEFRARCGTLRSFELPVALVTGCRLPQALVTVNPDAFTELILPRHELLRHFDPVITSWEQGTVDKGELCAAALARLPGGIAPAEALLLDNLPENVAAWRKRGGRGHVYTGDGDLRAALGSGLKDLAQACGFEPD